MRRARAALGLAAVIGLLASTAVYAGAARPDPLPDESGCDHYRGTPIDANDPTQRFELVVCPSADGVRATVQTSSLVSGWSVRASVGSWDSSGRELSLRETHFVESKPESGWRFCLIDELALTRTERGLSGTYVSEACNDRATLELKKLAPLGTAPVSPEIAPPPEAQPRTEPPTAEPPAAEPKPVGPVSRSEPAATPSPESSSCACRSTEDQRAPLSLALVTLLGLSSVRRARARRAR